MARFLTQTLSPKSQTLTQIPSLLTHSRPKSNRAHNPNGPSFIEIDIGSGSGSETDIQLVTKKIEDAIHSIYAQRAAPDWLPFRPGSSYWVPPRRSGKGSGFKAVDLVRMVKMAASMDRLTDEEEMALLTSRGWPSAAFFVEGNHKKRKSKKATAQSDDEE